jgi:hypothetical protein
LSYLPTHPLINEVEDDGNPFREGDRVVVAGGRFGFVEHCWASMVDTVTLPRNCRPWIIHRVTVAMDNGRRKTLHVSHVERAPVSAPPPPWRAVLGDPYGRPTTVESVQSGYRWWAKRLHPDHGGSGAAMAMLNAARDLAMKELAPRAHILAQR